MTPAGWAVASSAVGVGSCVQGSVGFGLNLIAAPVLLLIDTRLVPGPAVFLGLVLTLLMARRERGSVDYRGVGWAMVGRVPGVAGGAAAVAALTPRSLGITFSLLVLVAVGLSVSGWRLSPTPKTLVGAGAVSGFMGTTSSIGGPPMAMVYQRAPGPVVRGTLATYFVLGTMLTLTALAVVGRFGPTEVRASLALLPPLAGGFVLSRFVARRLDTGYTRRAILAISSAAAVAILVRELLL